MNHGTVSMQEWAPAQIDERGEVPAVARRTLRGKRRVTTDSWSLRSTRSTEHSIGELLGTALAASGKSQAWLARRCGVTPGAASQWCSDLTVPSLMHVARATEALRLDVAEVADLTGHMVDSIRSTVEPTRAVVPADAVLEHANDVVERVRTRHMLGHTHETEANLPGLARLLQLTASGVAARHRPPFAAAYAETTKLWAAGFRETRLPEWRGKRPAAAIAHGSSAPATLLQDTEVVIGPLETFGETWDDPSLQGVAALSRGHAHYVNRQSETAMRWFRRALECPIADSDRLMVYRTIALAAAHIGDATTVDAMKRRLLRALPRVEDSNPTRRAPHWRASAARAECSAESGLLPGLCCEPNSLTENFGTEECQRPYWRYCWSAVEPRSFAPSGLHQTGSQPWTLAFDSAAGGSTRDTSSSWRNSGTVARQEAHRRRQEAGPRGNPTRRAPRS